MEDKFRLLDLPVGTTMYLIQCDRTGENGMAKVVQYDGYELFEDKRTYDEPGKVKNLAYKQDCVRVRFNEVADDKVNHINFLFDVYDINTLEIFTFMGDEHLSHGSAEYPYMDVYFTTNKEKANDFVKEHFLKLAEKKYNDLGKQIEKICEFIVFSE